MSLTRRMINREIFKDGKSLNKAQQFRKNMIELEEQETMYGLSVSYTLSEVIFEDLMKQYGIKIKIPSDYKGLNDYNYDSIHAIYKELDRTHRFHIYAIAMFHDKIIIRGKLDKDISGYYRRKSGVKLKPGPKPKDG